jgi:predicted RNA binding protein YcfA (HicA-like mRNA interferase family)
MVRKEVSDLVRRARERGWVVEKTRGGHLRWRSPEGKVVFSGSTPSDVRAVRNIRSLLRRMGLIGVGLFVVWTLVLPALAQERVLAITTSQGWTWWWVPSSLQAVVLEAATRAAELRGWRVVSRPAQGVPVLSLSVGVSDEDVTSRGDWAVGTARVTVRAELASPDGAVWRGSRSSLALWLVRPFRTSRDAALERAAREASHGVTLEALSRLEGGDDGG